MRTRLWRDIVESLNDALIVVSTTLEVVTINPAAETLLGVSRANLDLVQELIGRNPWLKNMMQNCLESGQSLSHGEAKLAAHHRSVWVQTEVSPLLASRGKLQGAIVLLHDLSYQRGIGQRLARGSDESNLGLSPAGLAHEIKNPLTGIRGAAELLAGLFPSETRVQQYCELIMLGTDRLASLVEQVLSVSSPQKLKREPVNIHKVLHQALAMAGLYPRPDSKIKVEQLFDPSLPEVVGDSVALERVFLNLIKNATEAIGSSGTIRLRTRIETEFHLSSGGRRHRFLRVEVLDSGKGLSADQLAQLFTPFFTTKADGTGLGLILSQRIVALHGGKLWAEPSEDPNIGGMSFKVSLPVVRPDHLTVGDDDP